MLKNKNISRPRRGFTLVEISVVTAIIGLVSIAAVMAISTVQKNGRDAKRIADLSHTQVALERYFQRYGTYPRENLTENCTAGSCASSCDTSLGTGTAAANVCPQISGSTWGSSDLQPLVTEGYLQALPKDPLNQVANGISYLYIFEPDSQDLADSEAQGSPGCSSSNPRNSCRYILQTYLENGPRASGGRGTCIYTLRGGGGTPNAWNAANCKGNAQPFGWPNGVCCKQ